MTIPSSPVIAIDGPGGAGKGAIAHHLAVALGFHILDSGALYRLVGLAARGQAIGFDDEPKLAALAAQLDSEFVSTDDREEPIRILLSGVDVTRRLRTDEAGSDASRVAPLSRVRDAIKRRQRDFQRPPGLVADGRDMGTVVFPWARVKIYLTASVEVRAQRRYKQLLDKGISANLRTLFMSIQARDDQDMNRPVAPLRPADDALIIDSTEMTIDAVFARVLVTVEQGLALRKN